MMPILDFSTLLRQVTVVSKDNGRQFQTFGKIEAIQSLLRPTDYQLIHQGDLFLLYGQKPLDGQPVILISSHIDSVYKQCFCEEDQTFYRGTFDNSLTNAAVLYMMLAHVLHENVYIAFTGDEEKDSGGCRELLTYLYSQGGSEVKFALVTDVSNVGWEEGVPFSVENDAGIDLFTAHQLVEWLSPYWFSFLHEAEPDESWDYQRARIPALTLCIPVEGDMHDDAGVRARKTSVPAYCEVLTCLANNLAE